MLRTDEKEWYKQFWPWFLIALPTVVIIACLYTVYLALSNPLSMVKKDYYQEGLTINKNLAGLQKAKELGLRAHIQLQEGRILQLEMTSSALSVMPPELTLQFNHPVDDHKDLALVLHKKTDHTFRADQLNEQQWQLISSEKRWYLQLQPLNDDWILQGEMDRNRMNNILLDTIILDNNSG